MSKLHGKIKKIVCLMLVAVTLFALFAFTGCEKKKELSKYQIDAEYFPEEGKLVACMNFDYRNDTQNEIKILPFNLFPNAFREGANYEPISSIYRAVAYYDGESYGEIKIDGVENCEKWEVGGEDLNILYVHLTDTVFPDERVEITVRFTLTLAKLNHRTGIAQRAVNLGNFYPILCAYDAPDGFYECVYYSDGDPFYSVCADYEVTLTLPISYTAVASAAGKHSQKEGKNVYKYVLNRARDFAVAVSNQFQCLQKEAEGVEISYYFYEDSNAEETLDIASQAMTYFSKTFGEYAYDSYALVQTGFCYGGMEYPGMVLLSDGLKRENYHYTIVHETAHQWWYAGVGNNQQEYAWMDEGLAEYSTLLFYENHTQYGQTRESILRNALSAYKAYYSIYSQIFGESNTAMNRNLGSYISEYEYVNLTYNKGLLLFDALREGIGDNRFFAGLKEYYKTFCFEVALPEDMMACFKKMGVDVDGLFDSFVLGTALI